MDVGGELGGVLMGAALVMFCMDPGGEELGETGTTVAGPGDVFLAKGETGVVCFRWRSDVLMTLRLNLSVKESDRCGVEGSLGEGVLLDD